MKKINLDKFGSQIDFNLICSSMSSFILLHNNYLLEEKDYKTNSSFFWELIINLFLLFYKVAKKNLIIRNIKQSNNNSEI